MGRGTFRPSTSSTSRRYDSGHLLIFLNQPKPRRNWLTALEDHPALRERRKLPTNYAVRDPEPQLHYLPLENISRKTDETVHTVQASDRDPDPELPEPEPLKEPEVIVEAEDEPDVGEEEVEVYERDEVVSCLSWWLDLVRGSSSLLWDDWESEGSDLLLDTAQRVDPLHYFDWNNSRTHRGRVMRILSGGRNSQGRLHGKVEVVFSSGESLSGRFYEGRREGECVVSSPGRGVLRLTGVWSNNRLTGLAQCLYTDGVRAEGWVVGGAWHGPHRRYHRTGELALYGRCRNGKLVGCCWKFYPGGGALYGEVGTQEEISGPEAVYLYPDYLTGIKVTLSTLPSLSPVSRVTLSPRDSYPESE